MRTIVITGGTHGIGRALARQRLEAGDRVVAVGSSAARGERFRLETAVYGDRAEFVAADLATLRGSREVVDRIRAAHPVIDALVLGAMSLSPRREVTADGVERTFALYYLSRHVLAHGLRVPLERAQRPCVVNLSGPGITLGAVHWDDLQLSRRWSSTRATLQAGRANDLLGPAFAAAAAAGPVRYLAYNPGFTDTRPFRGMAQPWRAVAEAAAALLAAPADRTATAIGLLLDAPPDEPFSAWRRRGTQNRRIDPGLRTFDPAAAARLDAVTRELLAGAPG